MENNEEENLIRAYLNLLGSDRLDLIPSTNLILTESVQWVDFRKFSLENLIPFCEWGTIASVIFIAIQCLRKKNIIVSMCLKF